MCSVLIRVTKVELTAACVVSRFVIVKYLDNGIIVSFTLFRVLTVD